jgi:ribosomal protein S27E
MRGGLTLSNQKMIRIMCPNLACQRILAVPAHARGKLVRCRSCATTIRIPAKSAGGESAGTPAA